MSDPGPTPPPSQSVFSEAATDIRDEAADNGIVLGSGAIAALAGVALLIIFMAQNKEDVTLQFLFWDFTWRLWFLVLLSATVGALVWFSLGVLRRHRRRKHRREVRRGEVPG